jgi:hypothetical protein
MMMKMLEAGGLEPITDNIRTADEDNPKGYYELEKVKELKNDASWVDEARGKVVKVISALLQDLPKDHRYKIVFMQRLMPEILASQKQMLVRRGQPTDRVPDEKMAAMFEKHLEKIYGWIAEQPNMEVLYVKYNEVLADPASAASAIAEFLGLPVDQAAMTSVVDAQLYRQRKA